MKSKKEILTVAHSPDPDDAFMFYGISQGGMPLDGYRVKHILKDIQSLNKDALKGKYKITAISTAVFPHVAKKYWILTVGSSVGRNYGPLILCKPEKLKKLKSKDWSGLRIATPGPQTTAFLLLHLYRDGFKPVNMAFDKVQDAIEKDKVDAGIIIHEGQITYKSWGLSKIEDLGKWWYKETKLPIPLGLDVVRKDMGKKTAIKMANILYDSIKFAYKNKKDAVKYSLKYGRGINAKVGERFVKMYVNKDTLDMGKEGEKAIKILFEKAYKKGLLKKKMKFEFIRPSRN